MLHRLVDADALAESRVISAYATAIAAQRRDAQQRDAHQLQQPELPSPLVASPVPAPLFPSWMLGFCAADSKEAHHFLMLRGNRYHGTGRTRDILSLPPPTCSDVKEAIAVR